MSHMLVASVKQIKICHKAAVRSLLVSEKIRICAFSCIRFYARVYNYL